MTNKWGCYVCDGSPFVLFRLATSCAICCRARLHHDPTPQWSSQELAIVSAFTKVCSDNWKIDDWSRNPIISTHLLTCLPLLVFQSQCHAVLNWVNPSWSDLFWRPSYPSPCSSWSQMELKVWVDGVVRVVCGLSEETSCQDVVIALAQAIGEHLKLSFLLWNHCVFVLWYQLPGCCYLAPSLSAWQFI